MPGPSPSISRDRFLRSPPGRPYSPNDPITDGRFSPNDRIEPHPNGLDAVGEHPVRRRPESVTAPQIPASQRRRHIMRTTRLITAAVAAGALLAPATASAARLHTGQPHLRTTGPCTISETVEQHMITSGESAQVFGFLTCGGVGQTGQNVTVYERSTETGWTRPARHDRRCGLLPAHRIELSTDTKFYAEAAGIRSATKIVKVAPLVTVQGPSETSGAHPKASFSTPASTTSPRPSAPSPPADRGAQITLQREAASGYEEWHTIQNGFVGYGGVYAIRHRFVFPRRREPAGRRPQAREVLGRGASRTRSPTRSCRREPEPDADHRGR